MQLRDEMIGATVLGRYRIVARLAKGGMGVVYLARAEGAAGFAKPVVVKRVLPDLTGDEQMARLFVREAKILANLQHPNIVGVIEFGEEDGAYIMVLDYARAYHLGLWLTFRQRRFESGEGERLPIDGVVHIIIKVLDALEYAHGLTLPDGSPLEIVHADISPANILVDTDGHVKLLDFGIARMKGEPTKSTDSKSIRGKFSYLPIEALDGSPPTPMTDVYACGVTLYELLVGENPFTGSDETRTLARVISHDPPPVSELRPGVSAELDAIVARAMSKDRARRFATAKDFARELRRVQTALEDESSRALAAMAKSDYAAMPTKDGASLTELEAAWRSPSAAGPASEPRSRVVAPRVPPNVQNIGEGPTQILESNGVVAAIERTASSDAAGRRRLMAAVAGAVVIVVGVAVGLAVYLGRPAKEPQVLVIERAGNASGSGASSPSTSSAAAPSAGAAVTVDPAPLPSAAQSPASASVHAPKSPSDPLSAAFAKNQPEIEACFRDQATGVTGTPEVSVRFSIDKAGIVQRAELSPGELANAALGQCILGVARRTRFPAQTAPATFRIPLRARKAP